MIKLGVPCSAIHSTSFFPCTSEAEAIAIAFGMKLCGVEDIEVFMQNSGFGNCLDIITSLLIPYDVNINFEVAEGADQPQHQKMNKIYKQLFDIAFKGGE